MPDRLKKIIICRVVIPFYKIWLGHELYINFHKFRENAAFTHFICFGRFYELIKEHEQGRKSGEVAERKIPTHRNVCTKQLCG